jgi:hypothetical protein
MNRDRLFAAFVPAFVALSFAAPASAMYHPPLGRWTSRDPIGVDLPFRGATMARRGAEAAAGRRPRRD